MPDADSIAPGNAPSESSIAGPFHLGYRPALDGFRGVAITLVGLTHLELIRNNYGFIGVDMFFVLSGFLITCLLIQEWHYNKSINLRAFYIRRGLRLFPALLALLAGFVIYFSFFPTRAPRSEDIKETLLALFYSMNWAVALGFFQPGILSHTWSLSIEEQFYLLWPAVLFFMLRRNTLSSLANLTALLLVVACSERGFLVLGSASDFMRFSRGLDTRADALLAGCLLGVLISSGFLSNLAWLRPVLRYGSIISAAALGVMGHFFEAADEMMCLVGWFLISVFAGIMILELVMESSTGFSRFFNQSPLVYIGKISYGLYLWHWPVIMAMEEFHSPLAKSRILRLAITLIFTLASYYLIELPCLRLKRRFEPAALPVFSASPPTGSR